MTPRLQELLDLAGEPLLPQSTHSGVGAVFGAELADAAALGELLAIKNGFYAFESALLVRPVAHGHVPLGIVEWNAPLLWKNEYGGLLDDRLCFAEDVFGGQFALTRDAIVAIDPETGDVERVGQTLEEWADALLSDSAFRTGSPLAHAWQARNGRLAPGQRLVPKVPFVTGGDFTLENLYVMNDTEAMRFRGSVARQLRDVPDGGHVVFELKKEDQA